MEGTTGNSPYHDKVATEGFSSAFYTTSFGLEAPTLLHRQRAPLEEYHFQWGGNLLAKRDVNPTATRSAAPLLFTTWPTWLHTALSRVLPQTL